MEGPIPKFIHVQQSDTFWSNATPFKSPDLIELNSDSEKNVKTVDPLNLNYSSSQDEIETEDDANDTAESTVIGKDGVYNVASHDEESCHLLQTEDDSDTSGSEQDEDYRKSSDSHDSGTSNGVSSGSENASEGRSILEQTRINYEAFPYTNFWLMTPEQREYYTKQFLQLQPDPNGRISGEVAKPFFEKSRLPLDDLRSIWQLADITEDGYLDIKEFRVAMHFVVVRKHGLPIPSDYYDYFDEDRRHSWIQYAREQEIANHSKETNSTNEQTAASVSQQCSQGKNTASVNSTNKVPIGRSESEDLSISEIPQLNPSSSVAGNTVQKIIASSTTRFSSGIPEKQPLNSQKSIKEEWTTFDNEPLNFSSICDTSGLIAPVPVRLTTPEENSISNHPSNLTILKAQHLQLKSIQRPKLSGNHKSSGTGTIAPPPPPRRKTHVRSSSLDLNRLTISSELDSMTCERDVPGRNFFSPSHKGGAFSVYRKSQTSKSDLNSASGNKGYTMNDLREFKCSIENTVDELRSDVESLRNDNVILTKITTQLLEQLSTLQAKRKCLTFQLHQMSAELSSNKNK